MADDDNTTDFAGRVGVTRRDFLKATGLGAAALALGSMGGEEAAAQAAPMPSKPRFTLPPGLPVTFNRRPQIPPQLYNQQAMGQFRLAGGANNASEIDYANRFCIAVNMPIGGRPDMAKLIMDGGTADELAADIGRARLITRAHIVTPDKDDPDKGKGDYIRLGETRVHSVRENSVAISVTLQPGHRMALSNMPNTKIVPEADASVNENDVDNKIIANNTVEPQKVVLLIPEEDYQFKAPGVLPRPLQLMLQTGKRPELAEDFETLEEGMAAYNKARMASDKIAVLTKLKPLIDETRIAIAADLGARKQNPKKEPVYSDDEVKRFSGKAVDWAVANGVMPPPKAAPVSPKSKKKDDEPKGAPDGILEKFTAKFKVDMENEKLMEALKENGVSALGEVGDHVKSLVRREELRGFFPGSDPVRRG